MKLLLLNVFEYFMHASTWKAVISFITATGVAISPELADKIIAVGLAGVGLIQFFIDDSDKDKLADLKAEIKG